ncbi:MAG: RnfABCDGE type electron transport complex subunit D [Verrucomicrobia bacterium]|jgi:Na+-translocating ferredoxin:NAD+ oxidoreductase subunit D|nr:RnfABCDGE type electron transport complex subunit D [Verrucomicrobiota bacterium]
MAEQDTTKYIVSTNPHAHSGDSVQRIMLDVIIALIPATLLSFHFFGWHAVRLVTACVVGCVGIEVICRKLMGRDLGITDLSAVVTGLLLAFNLPPSLPCGMALVGCVFAIAIAKQLFGGIGYNPFNPALIGRVALLISFPVAMTKWHAPLNTARWAALNWVDGTTTATPLGAVKTAISMGQPSPVAWGNTSMLNYMLGNMSGCIGEVSALALIVGGLYLLYRRCISWHIPVAYIGTVAAFAAILRILQPDANMPVLFHLLSGGLMLGAIFMATDMVTSPLTKKGMLVFGIGCGLLTMVIRRWGGYPEGVSFAIILMNAITPLINRATRPRVFGRKSVRA